MKKLSFILSVLIFLGIFCTSSFAFTSLCLQSKSNSQDDNDLIITDENLDFSNFKVTFIELGADKCIPCRAMKPVMHEIAKEYKDIIQVVFYDVWKSEKQSQKYGVQIIPTQIFFDKNGDEIMRHVGFFSKDDIIKMLKEKGIL